MAANYATLLDAEVEKFRVGESSIFLLNSREQKLIDAHKKLNKLQTDFQKLKWKLRGAKGQLLSFPNKNKTNVISSNQS